MFIVDTAVILGSDQGIRPSVRYVKRKLTLGSEIPEQSLPAFIKTYARTLAKMGFKVRFAEYRSFVVQKTTHRTYNWISQIQQKPPMTTLPLPILPESWLADKDFKAIGTLSPPTQRNIEPVGAYFLAHARRVSSTNRANKVETS